MIFFVRTIFFFYLYYTVRTAHIAEEHAILINMIFIEVNFCAYLLKNFERIHLVCFIKLFNYFFVQQCINPLRTVGIQKLLLSSVLKNISFFGIIWWLFEAEKPQSFLQEYDIS